MILSPVMRLGGVVSWGMAAMVCTGCWTSRVIDPAIASRPGTTGYGVEGHLLYAVFASASVAAIGVVAHSPSLEFGQEGDSLWMVTNQTSLTYCAWTRPGGAECSLAEFRNCPHPSGDPLRIVDPVNLGSTRTLTQVPDPATGGVRQLENGVMIRAVEADQYVPDKAIWMLNGASTDVYRCSIEGGSPVCRAAAMQEPARI